eukprot:TRINITY_DN9402_c0_g1_i1.p1 TRINITY_DN9402_c0_g1~~TRINITY_DN9402_c0_g1_i1.p1  ORF type:complete len:779 (-),score=68.51 TRINITY_DN9402_c0_g1_i1:46-2382(-)
MGERKHNRGAEEVWENQRYYTRQGWDAPDPANACVFSTENAQQTHGMECVELPAGCEWSGNWRIAIDEKETDDEGWMYANDWNSTRWAPKAGWHSYVRRRRWVRNFHRLGQNVRFATDALSPVEENEANPSTKASANESFCSAGSIDSAALASSEASSASRSGPLQRAVSPESGATGNCIAAPSTGEPAVVTFDEQDEAFRQPPPPRPESPEPTPENSPRTPVPHGGLAAESAIMGCSAAELQRVRMAQVDTMVRDAMLLHENAHFRTAACQLVLSAEVILGLLRQVFQGRRASVYGTAAGGTETDRDAVLDPAVLFQQWQLCADRLQHIYLKCGQSTDAVYEEQPRSRARTVASAQSNTNTSKVMPRVAAQAQGFGFTRNLAPSRNDVTDWVAYVSQHFEWRGGTLSPARRRHFRFLLQHQRPGEGPPLGPHLHYLITHSGTPLQSAVQAFGPVLAQLCELPQVAVAAANAPTEASVEECQQKLHRARDAIRDFHAALVSVAARRLFPPAEVDSASQAAAEFPATVPLQGLDTLLSALVARAIQARAGILLAPLYRHVFHREDSVLNTALEAVGCEGLFWNAVPESYRNRRDSFFDVGNVLSRLSLLPHVHGKLRCVVDTIRAVHRCLEGRTVGTELLLTEEDSDEEEEEPDAAPAFPFAPSPSELKDMPSPPSSPASPTRRGGLVGADVMFPVFIYCVLLSRVPYLWSESQFMSDFIEADHAAGHQGYALVTLQSALTYILQKAGPSVDFKPERRPRRGGTEPRAVDLQRLAALLP